MKSLKKLLSVLVVVTLMAAMLAVPVFAASLKYEDEAKVLYDLGLFKGKSETAYVPALEDRLLREEAVAVLLRMFKLEEEALKMDEKEAATSAPAANPEAAAMRAEADRMSTGGPLSRAAGDESFGEKFDTACEGRHDHGPCGCNDLL